MNAPTKSELQAARCWFSADRVPGRPDITAFKQEARLRQARWRATNDLPIGHSPYDPSRAKGKQVPKEVGSRIEYEVARSSRRNLLSDAARAAAERREAEPQPHQMLSWDRLWCDCLSSMPFCFNLFGPMSVDLALAQKVVGAWFPDAPGQVIDVLLEWSPGRRGEDFLGNGTAFDAAIILGLEDGTRGVIGIETKYHEHLGPETPPSPIRETRYRQVAEKSGAFRRNAVDSIIGRPLQQLWQDHLLALSMTQGESTGWSWAQFVVVYPARNPAFAEGAEEYRALLSDTATFDARTLESLLTADALPAALAGPIADRYVW